MLAWCITSIVLPIVGAILIPGVCAEGAPMVENIRFSNGDTWSGKGELEDGLIVNGKGIYKWANGDIFDGQMVDGMMHGEGKMTYKDGSEYSGGWFKAKRHGKGTFKGKEGDVYSGQFKDGVAHGKGIYKWANGETYDGELLDGMAHGEGRMTYKDGSQYVGEWLVGTRHGFGIYTSMWKFYQYKGGWSNDKRHGKGVKSYFWHFVECEEEWDHGKMRGVRTCRFLFLQTLVEDTWHYHYLCLDVVLWWMFRIHKELADVKATASWSRCNIEIEKLKHDERRDDDELVVRLDQDHIHCGICYEAFTSDMESTDQNSREKLPVLGSCGHYFCHGCIIRCRTMVGSNGAVGCPKCMKANQFVRGNPIHHRMLIDLLERALPVENLRRGQ
eukprot:scaffold12201_cov75-Skeletonema_dohrnii-CCMP3373.AAC.1